MKPIYDTETTLSTHTKAKLDINYNRTIATMSKPGDVIYYQAPSDPAERPLYVDAEGRPVPVDPATLQPMKNSSGRVVDKNGVEVPVYDKQGHAVHIDDVRVAIASADYNIKNEKEQDIYIAHDGAIIPTDEHGIPGTTLVNGEVWVVGDDGSPYAPLTKVHALKSYVKPVRGENYPMSKTGVKQTPPEDKYTEYFDVNAIVAADRPRRRGVLYAWAADDAYDYPAIAGTHGYDGPRFYTVSEDSQYKYWVSPTVSDAAGVTTGTTVTSFDTWNVVGATNKVTSTNQISADFGSPSEATYFDKALNLDDESSYQFTFNALAQANTWMVVDFVQWSDILTATDYNSPSKISSTRLKHVLLPAGQQVPVDIDITPSANTQTHSLKISFYRTEPTVSPKVTLSALSAKQITYPISGVGPRAVYDRPIVSNKIVIGVDYSVDGESARTGHIHVNKPNDSQVRVYVDRGDGLFEWVVASTNPTIDENGFINIYYNGSTWGNTEYYDRSQVIMGVQYNVYGLKRKDVRVPIMEIAAHRTFDLTEDLDSYSVNSEVADSSYILPFGTVNKNTGEISLSNNDGKYNHNNKYLLDTARLNGEPVFTSEINPFYQLLGSPAEIIIETATFVPGSEDRDYLRMVTAKTLGNFNASSQDMSASVSFTDDSALLEGIIPLQTFYTSTNMSVIQVLYSLLDSVGFTSVNFADEDDHFSAHMKYFWTNGDDKNLWEIITEVCRATQTVAFFDEYNVLNFKSLHGMYVAALGQAPSQLYTSEDVSDVKANIQTVAKADDVTANKVTINYREIKEPEKTPSGITPMEELWRPSGTEVLRSNAIIENLDDKTPEKGGSTYLVFASGITKTWPFAGKVQIEGEFIKYEGKQYKYYVSSTKYYTAILKNDDDRKKIDQRYPDFAMKNVYTGKLKITERGADGSLIRAHSVNKLSEFTRRYKASPTATTVDRTYSGLSISNSKLKMTYLSTNPTTCVRTVSDGSTYDSMPRTVGSQFKISQGGHAGVCFGLSGPDDDGIFIELSTTESIEAQGRPRGEFHVFTRVNGVVKYYGTGVDVPVSKNKYYTMDVSIVNGGYDKTVTSYSAYYGITLKYGSRGAAVTALQQGLNRRGEKINVTGIFYSSTRDAVKRLQAKNGLTQDGIVGAEEWKALEVGRWVEGDITISASIDETYTVNVVVPKAEVPGSTPGGRFGVFTRSQTTAYFEYLYAQRGTEDVEPDESQFFDYVDGGFVSDQLDARWIYTTRTRYRYSGGKYYQRKVINNQLYMCDFGPYAHEVRDYEVKFDKDAPALSSFVYFSNDSQVMCTDYVHKPFGAKFTLVNKARHAAVLEGEDSMTFGSENSVNQHMLVYGSRLKIDDERAITVSDKTSMKALGTNELTIDVDWMQTEASAKKLGSHIVEAMSHSVSTYNLEVFGNASARVGQIVSVYSPKDNVGVLDDPINSNRFFVTGVAYSNDGTSTTSLTVREVIGYQGFRAARLADVVKNNNNALNYNPSMEEYYRADQVSPYTRYIYRPKGYLFRSGVKAGYVSKPIYNHGNGAAYMVGTGSTAYNSSMRLRSHPDGIGRFAYNYGDYFLFTATVTAERRSGVRLALEGWPTTTTSEGTMIKVLYSTSMTIDAGETKTLVLKGRLLDGSNPPEIEAVIRLLNPDNRSEGGSSSNRIYVHNAFFRTSQNQEDIYPLNGMEALKIT